MINEDLCIENKNILKSNKKYQLAYLVGVLLGDGCLYINDKNKKHHMYQFSITTSDLDMVLICKDIIFNIFKKESNIKTINKKDSIEISYYQLIVCSKKICLLLKKLTNNRTKIPYIKKTDINSIKFLCCGLMDSDGYICKVNANDGFCRYRIGYHASSLFIEDFIKLLNMIGITTGKLLYRKGFSNREGKRKNEKDSYSFSINTKSYFNNLFFLINRKQSILQEYNKRIILKND